MIRVGAIHDVKRYSLKRFYDSRGAIFRVMGKDDDFWMPIGQVYCSYIKPGAIKAWHLHEEITLNYAVPNGTIELILFDDRPDSPTRYTKQSLHLGVAGVYELARIPPGIWNGFRSLLKHRGALIINAASHPYNPEEITRLRPEGLLHDEQLVHDWRLIGGK